MNTLDVERLKAFCASLPGAEARQVGPPANILVYAVHGKRFAHFKTSPPEQWRFSLKVPTERFLELTDLPGIRPARWLGRYHWITVVEVARMPAADLRAWVLWSHGEAVRKLPKRVRAAL